MEERYILGQQALTPDGAVYQIIWDEPYNEDFTPDAVAQGLPNRAPENTVAGSTCIYNTEDADGYPVEWLFAFDGTNWVLDRVVRGGGGGGGGGMVIPEITAVMDSDMKNGTYTSTVSYDEMVQLIRNSSYQSDEGNMYPAYFAVTGAFINFTGIEMGDGLIYAMNWALHADGTVTGKHN